MRAVLAPGESEAAVWVELGDTMRCLHAEGMAPASVLGSKFEVPKRGAGRLPISSGGNLDLGAQEGGEGGLHSACILRVQPTRFAEGLVTG